MSERARSRKIRRALITLSILAVLYGIAAEIAGRVIPRHMWLAVHYVEDVAVLPSYGALAEETVFLVRAGLLGSGIVVSGLRVLGGLLVGALVGVPLGIAMARLPRFGDLVEPWLALLRFTPALALLPLSVLWLGPGEASKILLIAAGVAVVMAHGAFEGARGVPAVYLDAAAALGARPPQTLRRVVLPAALPHLVTSIRIAAGLAWVTIVVAELIQPTMPSLGYLLALSGAYPRVSTMFVALATIGALVLAGDALAVAGYHRATAWMRRHDD